MSIRRRPSRCSRICSAKIPAKITVIPQPRQVPCPAAAPVKISRITPAPGRELAPVQEAVSVAHRSDLRLPLPSREPPTTAPDTKEPLPREHQNLLCPL